MPSLEDDLRTALGRKPAPEGFADRLSARLPHEGARPAASRSWRALPWRWGLAAAAVVLAVVAAGSLAQRTRVERRNARALKQTLSALSLAAAQLERAEKRAFAPERWPQLGSSRDVQTLRHVAPAPEAPLHSSDPSPRT